MKSLVLFNAVEARPQRGINIKPHVCTEDGYLVEPDGLWALPQIIEYYKKARLSGEELNKTFHKSWDKIKNSSRFELLVDQILHYLTTYGSNFEGEIYIPNEVLHVPDVKLKFKVVKAYSKEDLTTKALNLLQSGIALDEETIKLVLSFLIEDMKYKFTGKENIRNKEANILLAEMYGVFPSDPVEFLRYLVYRMTDSTLLIKNQQTIDAIKNSGFNPTMMLNKYNVEKLAEIFNRYKPLFLAMKKKCPKTINRISKLSKVYHKPMPTNGINLVTSCYIKDMTAKEVYGLRNATPFALFKALYACNTRALGQDTFTYRIRNGKSWSTEGKADSMICSVNFQQIEDLLRTKFDFSDQSFYFPKDIVYALPTSEKMFVGNIPTGTKFLGEKLVAGIYWENSWGAHDLDLSGINIGGKVGWNSTYNQGSGRLLYSGDITNAPNGAVEYLYANKGLNTPTLVMNNIYTGTVGCDYKIIVGKGDDMSRDYMMNPNNRILDVKTTSVEKMMLLGIFMPHGIDQQSFTLLNFGAGKMRVAGNTAVTNMLQISLFQQWHDPITFEGIIRMLGGKFVDDPIEADHDFSLDALEKDSFIKLFK